VLRPDVNSLAWDDFHRADEAIEAGASAARIALPRIRKLLELAAADSAATLAFPQSRPLTHSQFLEALR
jgi:predicted acylesterase/phospholipase RssA